MNRSLTIYPSWLAACAIPIMLSVAGGQAVPTVRPERCVSPSGQFVVYAPGGPLRGAISELAESTKSNLLRLLQRHDSWRTPLIVNLQSRQANLPEVAPSVLRFSQTGFGLKLQLDLTVDRSIDKATLEREVLRGILLEMIYRKQPKVAPGTPFSEAPKWLIEGVLALTPGRDRAPAIEALLLTNGPIPLKEFLHQRSALLESPADLLYCAYSMALVQLLLEEPQGPVRLGRYIDGLWCASNDPVADLAAYFPSFGGDVEKIWRRGVLRLSARQNYQLLSFAETSQRLDTALHIEPGGTGHPTKLTARDDLWQRQLLDAERTAIILIDGDLFVLALRAHPLLRPIIEEYRRITALLSTGKGQKLGKRLAVVSMTRKGIFARMTKIEDYLNWFEATQSKSQSGAFANYLSAAREQNETHLRRQDALSVYLDSLADQFEN